MALIKGNYHKRKIKKHAKPFTQGVLLPEGHVMPYAKSTPAIVAGLTKET